MSILIEAAVESLDAALVAAAGGAQRIELCADLSVGGLTPDPQLIRDCRAQLGIPIFVLVRPRPGNFNYTKDELRVVSDQILAAKEAGAHGIVTGALEGKRISPRTAELVAAARPLPLTFHRAFDECIDLGAALEQLIEFGVERVLTSGGMRSAADGVAQLRQLVKQAKGRIAILAGGGIDASTVVEIVQTGVREVHFSVRDAKKVKLVLAALAQLRQ